MAEEKTWTRGWQKLVEAEARRKSLEAERIIPPYHENMGEDRRRIQAALEQLREKSKSAHYTPLRLEEWFRNLPKK